MIVLILSFHQHIRHGRKGDVKYFFDICWLLHSLAYDSANLVNYIQEPIIYKEVLARLVNLFNLIFLSVEKIVLSLASDSANRKYIPARI